MDGVSAAASVAQLVFMTGNVVVELKQFYDSTKVVQNTIDGLIKDTEALKHVLQCMQETLNHLSSHHDSSELHGYWTSVNNALRDGQAVVEKLHSILASVDRPGKLWEKGRKKIRLDSAQPQIEIYRQHIQSYRDILHLCLQTMTFWNQVAERHSNNMLVIGLSNLQESVHTNARQINEKLEQLESLAISQPEEAQVAAMGRLRECVKSVAGIVTTATASARGTDRTSVIAPSEFDVYFPEEHGFMLRRWTDTTTEAIPEPEPDLPYVKTIVSGTVVDDRDEESDSDTELEFQVNEKILKSSRLSLSEGELAKAEKLLRDRLDVLSRSGASTSRSALSLDVQLALAKVLYRKTDFEGANKLAKAARKGYIKLIDREQELACLELMTEIAKSEGHESYYEAYSQMCSELRLTRSNSVTLENLSSLRTSSASESPPTMSPQQSDPTGNTTGRTDNSRKLRTPRTVASQATLGHETISSFDQGDYQDAKEYPDISTVISTPNQTALRYNASSQQNGLEPHRQASMAESSGSSNTRSTFHPSSASSVDVRSEASTSVTTVSNDEIVPLDIHPRQPIPVPAFTHPFAQHGQSQDKPGAQQGVSISNTLPQPSIKQPTLKADFIHPIGTNTTTDSGRSTPSKTSPPTKPPTGGAWSRSGVGLKKDHAHEDTNSSRKGSTKSISPSGIFGKLRLKSSAGIGEALNPKPGTEAPRLPDIPLTQSPTSTSIDKNWIQVSALEAEVDTESHVPALSTDPTMRKRKIVCVGDSGVGKTSLLERQREGIWRETPTHRKSTKFLRTTRQKQPTLNAPYAAIVSHPRDHIFLELTLWDTPGQFDGFELHRPTSYLGSHVVVICFAADDRGSLENVEKLWYPEIERYCPDAPIILVSCKSDLRQHNSNSPGHISAGEAEVVKHRIGAFIYLECSAVNGDGITQLFDYATVAACAASAGSTGLKQRQNSGANRVSSKVQAT